MIIVRSQSAAAPKAIIICQRNDLLLKKMSVESSFLCSFASRCQLIKITFIEKSSRTVYIHFGLLSHSILDFQFHISSSSTSTFFVSVHYIAKEINSLCFITHTHAGVQARLSRGRNVRMKKDF